MQRLLLGFLFALGVLFGEDKWTRYETEHFELLTNSGKGRSLDILTRFEQVRWYFGKRGTVTDPKLKPRIILYGREKDFKEFRPSENAGAYYIKLPQRDYIVMGPGHADSAEDERVAVHEYIHLLLRNSDIEVPVWLNEGMAELYSTVEAKGDNTLIGRLIPSHLFNLRDNWLPWSQVIEVNHDSPLYRSSRHAGTFYSMSWAATHMLMLSKEFNPKFTEFYGLMIAGKPTAAALSQVYGLGVKEFEERLRAYSRGAQFYGNVDNTKFTMARLKQEGTPAEPAQILQSRADLHFGAKRLELAIAIAKQTASAAPESFEPYELLGHCYWRQDNRELAGKAFAKAVELGSPSVDSAMFAVSMLSAQERQAQGPDLIRRALQTNPKDPRLTIELAGELLMGRKFDEAYATVASVKKITKKEVSRYFPIIVQSAWFSKNFEEAKKAAGQYARIAQSEEEKQAARHWVEFASREFGTFQAADAKQVDTQQETPTLRRNLPPKDFSESTEVDPRDPNAERLAASKAISGKFAEFICNENAPAVLALDAAGVRHFFVLEDPESILINKGNGAFVEFRCGKQDGSALTVNYGPLSSPEVAKAVPGKIAPLGRVIALRFATKEQ